MERIIRYKNTRLVEHLKYVDIRVSAECCIYHDANDRYSGHPARTSINPAAF